MRVRISRRVVQAIQRAAAEAAPREACGLLFGDEDEVAGAQTTANVAKDPERRFEIDPEALFAAIRAERGGGPAIAGYWHSHPGGEATPSATDARMAAADGKLWLIVAGEAVTAWRAERGGFGAVALEVA